MKVVAVVVRVIPAATAPKADTLPNASVAVLVPAPADSATPATSLLNTRLMELLTVAVTVRVPVAVCAAANVGIISTAAAMVKSTSFFMVGSSLFFSKDLFRYFDISLRYFCVTQTQLAVAVKLRVAVIGVPTAGPPAPGAAVETTKLRLWATSAL